VHLPRGFDHVVSHLNLQGRSLARTSICLSIRRLRFTASMSNLKIPPRLRGKPHIYLAHVGDPPINPRAQVAIPGDSLFCRQRGFLQADLKRHLAPGLCPPIQIKLPQAKVVSLVTIQAQRSNFSLKPYIGSQIGGQHHCESAGGVV
jgi:hypothetical protein